MEDVALVNKARRALANSYVFAYYAFDPSSPLSGTKLTLFQDKQQQLEQEVSKGIVDLVKVWFPSDLYLCLCLGDYFLFIYNAFILIIHPHHTHTHTHTQQCEVFAGMLVDMHVPNIKKRPKALEVTSQRDKLRHWLQVRPCFTF